MNFIKKIFENKSDEKVHQQFTKFSKGVFEHRALLDITIASSNIKIKTSSEFANELVEFLANTIKGSAHAKGIIFATRNLTEETTIEFKEIKSAMGVRKHVVDQELTREQILDLCRKFPYASINLSFKTDYGSLNVKEKAPKSGKPGKKGKEMPSADYCTFVTNDAKILDDYAFGIKEKFKKAIITHTYVIEDIIIPEKYMDDFAMARINARRKGKILRRVIIDGKESVSETGFEA